MSSINSTATRERIERIALQHATKYWGAPAHQDAIDAFQSALTALCEEMEREKDGEIAYRCGECGARGVRLYREYETFMEHITLRCRACACKHAGQEPDQKSEHSIGWLVAAVPTYDRTTFWGYTSIPQEALNWWNKLPKEPLPQPPAI